MSDTLFVSGIQENGKNVEDNQLKRGMMPPLIAAVCAVILVAAGIVGWNAYSGAKLAEAEEACAAAADTVRNNANEYNALLNGDAADAAAVKAEQVEDSKTAEHRLRLLEHVVDSYGDQPPERIRYLLFAPKNGVCDYDRIRLKDRRKIINGPIGSVCDYL